MWPGVRLGPWHIGKSKFGRRPDFFRARGPMPIRAALLISKPPAFGHMDDESYLRMVEKAVDDREKELRAERAESGKGFLGVQGVLNQRSDATPWSKEGRTHLKPGFASHDKWRRIQALQQDKEWLQCYRDALAAYRAGNRDVEFPAGTYWMARFAGAKCARYEPG